MMDPGVPGTDKYLADICREIVKNYDVDGIHLDYIRYPERGIAFNDNRTYNKYGKKKSKAAWRKENVTRCVKAIHKAVKDIRPWVKLSCSPIGKYADLRTQSSYGWNARDAVHQDVQAWLRDGLMDMIFPMMYFDGKHFYPFAINWKENSYGKPYICMDEEHFLGMQAAKRTNYDMIYKVDKVQRVLDVQVKPIMQKMYYKLLSDLKNGVKSSPVFKHHIDFIANHHYKAKKPYFESTEPNQIVVDYMASMTDDYCIELYHFLFPNDNVDFKYHGYFEDLYRR